MPEIKNTFTSGKMNKDLDERLLKKGEYRDAMNIQISTSEGSDVGAVENILGNIMLHDTFIIPNKSKCVGAIADEKNDVLYWFTFHRTKDAILKYDRKTNKISPVLIDINKNVLNFSANNIITGINVIDNLLFWTDNRTEPKKINITNCERGTDSTGLYHTRLIVKDKLIDYNIAPALTEDHITVIKKSPKQKLTVEEIYLEYNPSSTIYNFTEGYYGDDDGLYEINQRGFTTFTDFINEQKYNVGDVILLINSDEVGNLPEDSQISIELLEDLSGNTEYDNNPLPPNTFKFKVTVIDEFAPAGELTYNCLKQYEADGLLERKFSRFSYRYKYQDGEYSTFAPFTDVIFKPGKFEYDAFKAYNIGMENRLESLKLRNFITPETSEDVVQVDILYKESNSPIVYIVDKIKYNDYKDITVSATSSAADNYVTNAWLGNQYEIKSDLIYAALPANQILRPYDNVPRQALAQEVSGNRVIYANYLQNYDITDSEGNYFKPVLKSDYESRWYANKGYTQKYVGNLTSNPFILEEKILPLFGHKSLKSMRNYQVGLTYLDKYGRETPIFSNKNSIFKLPKKHGGFKTKINGQIITDTPSWAESYKIYVKETSSEYYNMAMSRVYRAEDGNIWMAFPSAERNKIDEDTFLILKKGADKNQPVKEKARYKVLAIENNAPDFIKTQTNIVGEIEVAGTNTTAHDSNPPTVDSRFFDISVSDWDGSNAPDISNLTDTLSVEWISVSGTYTSRYEITSVVKTTDDYTFTLNETFKTSDSWIYPSFPSAPLDASGLELNLRVRVYQNKVVNKPEFKGVFFVKISSDPIAEKFVFAATEKIVNYEVTNKINSHYFSDTNAPNVITGTTSSSNAGLDNSPGLTSSKEEWGALLDFGGGSQIGGFFIDEAFYRGVHYDTEDQFGRSSRSEGFQDQHLFNTDQFSIHPYSYQNLAGFGRGIFEEAGKHYVEISFSIGGINAAIHGGGQFNLENNATRLNQSGWDEDGQGGLGMHSEVPWDLSWDVAMQRYVDSEGGQADQLSQLQDKLNAGVIFKIFDDSVSNNIFRIVGSPEVIKRYNYTNYERVFSAYVEAMGTGNTANFINDLDSSLTTTGTYDGQGLTNDDANDIWKFFQKGQNRRTTFRLEVENISGGSSDLSKVILNNGKEILHADNSGTSSSFQIQFLKPSVPVKTKQIVSRNPVIWETEPKESADLNLFYEASDALPLVLDNKNFHRFIPKGSIVTCPSRPDIMNPYLTTTVKGFFNGKIELSNEIDSSSYQGVPAINGVIEDPYLVFTRPDTSYTSLKLDLTGYDVQSGPFYTIIPQVGKNPFALSWHNCYSFVNGVESNRLRDTFNSVTLDKGAIVSSTLDETYEMENRKSGLIYSGLYNSTSGVNNLNQFIQAEKITKDLNPTYGSIQKLYSRGGDLIAFCEDRVIKILANKDALFNADGNSNLVSTNRVLGEAVPFAGEYGISKNPESFASENYRAYFTDKQRGAVLRLSMDGLTPISAYGMDDYFKDHLKLSEKLIGSYDDKKDNYNITILDIEKTISYEEKVRGWSSFKSFVSESYGLSMANDYYTFEDGLIWRHHSDNPLTKRNTFYGRFVPSSVSTLLNDASDIVKTYKTINYEGSQSNVNLEATSVSSGYYNLRDIDGWSAESIVTNLQEGYVSEFIKKEGKWFNYIKGNDVSETLDIKTNEFSFQGIGKAESIVLDPSLYVQQPPVLIPGCMDPLADNYDPNATTDNGSCTYTTPIYGCTDSRASNYDPNATIDDNSCVMGLPGCTDPRASNYNPNATIDDGSCFMSPNPPVYGCTDPRALNYNPNATIDNGTCIMGVQGCIDPLADNYNPLANQDDGTCTYSTGIGPNSGGPGNNPSANGCTDPTALNYSSAALIDDGSCIYPTLTIQDTNDDD